MNAPIVGRICFSGDEEDFQDVFFSYYSVVEDGVHFVTEVVITARLIDTPTDLEFDIAHAIACELGISDSLVRIKCRIRFNEIDIKSIAA